FSWASIVDPWLDSVSRPARNPSGRVAISGLPYFVENIFNSEAETSTGWKHRMLQFNSHFQGFAALFDLVRSDTWYSVGSMYDGRMCEMYAAMRRMPRVIHWIGSDIAKVRSNATLIRQLRKPNIVHLAE